MYCWTDIIIVYQVQKSMLNGSWLADPSSLNTFVLTVYAVSTILIFKNAIYFAFFSLCNSFFWITFFAGQDLKNFHFHYWNCVPAAIYPRNVWQIEKPSVYSSSTLINEYLKKNGNKPFVLINNLPNSLAVIASLDLISTDYVIVFPDPSTKCDCPGWPLRNFVAALAYTRFILFLLLLIYLIVKNNLCNIHVYIYISSITFIFLRQDISNTKILCYRTGEQVKSVIIQIAWSLNEDDSLKENISIVGWDRNISGQLASRFMDLSTTMDPIQSVFCVYL